MILIKRSSTHWSKVDFHFRRYKLKELSPTTTIWKFTNLLFVFKIKSREILSSKSIKVTPYQTYFNNISCAKTDQRKYSEYSEYLRVEYPTTVPITVPTNLQLLHPRLHVNTSYWVVFLSAYNTTVVCVSLEKYYTFERVYQKCLLNAAFNLCDNWCNYILFVTHISASLNWQICCANHDITLQGIINKFPTSGWVWNLNLQVIQRLPPQNVFLLWYSRVLDLFFLRIIGS